MNSVLKITNVSKKYKNNLVLDKVSMTINKGDIYGFVGENGSGKTTIIRLIVGLIYPLEGDIEIFNINTKSKEVFSVKNKIGAIVEAPSIYKNMSARDNLITYSKIINLNNENKIKETLEIVGLGELYNNPKKAGNFSLGMRQRLGIAIALLGDPEFIILDEPMNGLDPAGIVEIRELILKLNKEKQITFLISSHILNELSLIANKYGIISKGKLVKEITNEELKNECKKHIIMSSTDNDKLFNLLSSSYGIENVNYNGTNIKLFGDHNLNDLFKLLIDNNIEVNNIKTADISIEDYYLSLIGNRR